MDDRGAGYCGQPPSGRSPQRRAAPPPPRPAVTPLQSAEPELVTDAERAGLRPAVGERVPKISRWIKDLAAGRSLFAGQLASRQNLMVPEQDPGYADISPAFSSWPEPGGDALLQPPRPQIRHSARVLYRAGQREADVEAAL